MTAFRKIRCLLGYCVHHVARFRHLEKCSGLWGSGVLEGSWDLVTRVIIRVTILITPIKVLITLLTKSDDPPSMGVYNFGVLGLGFLVGVLESSGV